MSLHQIVNLSEVYPAPCSLLAGMTKLIELWTEEYHQILIHRCNTISKASESHTHARAQHTNGL